MPSIRQKGPNQWQAQIRRKGWPIQNATLRTKKDAQAWARDIESKMDRGVFVDQAAARKTTLAELIAHYRDHVTANRPSEHSRIAEKLQLNRLLRHEPTLCAYAVINLTPEHFEEFRDRRKKQRLKNGNQIKPATVNKDLKLIKRVIDHRKRRLGLIKNPLHPDDVKLLAENNERDVRISLEERERLYSECSAARNELLRPFVELAFETGARRGNLLRLTWDDIDFEKQSALMRNAKNSHNPDKVYNYTIGLSPRAIEILIDLPRTNERVFPITANALRLAFNRARQKADLEHFNLHDARHERASSMAEAGKSTSIIMAQTGHRDPKSLKRYMNIRGDHLARELAEMSNESVARKNELLSERDELLRRLTEIEDNLADK